MGTHKLVITPKTKVLNLIETYPQLEDALINYVPSFKKLKNPVLRNTVAKIATLQQAAAIGNVRVEELINMLRELVGQELISANEENKYITNKPEWYRDELVTKCLDIREMLNAGEQPINRVMSDLHNLNHNEIYQITASFIPAPLIDKASGLKIKHWIDKQSGEIFKVYFIKQKD